MTPERAEEIFDAVRLHFASNSYDYVKYQGKIKKHNKSSPSSFYLSKKIQDEKHVEYFFVSNQLKYYFDNGRFCGFIPELVNDQGFKVYENFLKTLKNLEMTLKSNLDTFFGLYDISEVQNINTILRLFHTNKMSYMTILHIFLFLKVEHKWIEHSDILSEDFLKVIRKSVIFFSFKKEKFLQILKESYQNRV